MLSGYVVTFNEIYPNLFEGAQELYKAELTGDKLLKAAKRKAEEISKFCPFYICHICSLPFI